MKITKLIKLLQKEHLWFKKHEPWEDEIEVEISIDEEGNDFHDIAIEKHKGRDILRATRGRYKKNNTIVISLYPNQYDSFGDDMEDERYTSYDEDQEYGKNIKALYKKSYGVLEFKARKMIFEEEQNNNKSEVK